MAHIHASESPFAARPDHVGGKAANLARFDVIEDVSAPPWFVIDADLFRKRLHDPELRQRIESALEAKDAGAARALVRNAPLPSEFRKELTATLSTLAGPDDFLAVRSSALGEDSARLSFAGQMDSFLFVRGVAAVENAIKACHASAFSDRALAYRMAKGLGTDDIAVAVIVQRMVPSEVSGVLFTVDPIRNDRDHLLVNATYGLGEGVVQGNLVTDTWRISKDSGEVEAEVREKDARYVFDTDAGHGTRIENLPAESAKEPCLSPEQLRQLSKAALAVENALGKPQDIEFAFADGKLHLLQTRPVTTLPAGPEDGPRRVWDNSNIIESYAGVTTPLTFSFIRRAYASVYDQFLEIMGVPSKTRSANQALFANMLGLIRGQVYYNLRNWYALIRFFPGYRYNRDFMEKMMGVKERWEDDDPASAQNGFARRYLIDLPRMLRTGLRMILNLFTVDKKMQRFLGDFNQTHARVRALPLETLPAHELQRHFHELEDEVLRKWKPPILSDFYAMIFHGVLGKLMRAWDIDPNGNLQNDLLCGDDRIESSESPRMLMQIALQMRNDPKLHRLLKDHDAAALTARWRAGEFPESISSEINAYLDQFGDRGMNELKLEEPTPREKPDFLFSVFRNYALSDAAPDPEGMVQRQTQTREDAEAKVREQLGTQRLKWGLRKQTLFQWVLTQTRRHVRNRENQRLARTRVFSLVRRIFLGFGNAFTEEGVLRSPEDIFYLTVEEIFDFAGGTAVTTDLQALVEVRKNEFQGYRRAEPPADRFETHGLVYCRNPFRNMTPPAPVSGEEGDLRGTSCCGGHVRGPVRVILAPGDDLNLNGEILVAEKTDPGWIPLYPSISGLLIERGSVLSHSAIVAREMGIPAIVGIPGLTATLKENDQVEMDAGAGWVKILNRNIP